MLRRWSFDNYKGLGQINSTFVGVLTDVRLTNSLCAYRLERFPINPVKQTGIVSWSFRIHFNVLVCCWRNVSVTLYHTVLFYVHVLSKGAFTPDANEANKSRYSRVVGRLNILSLLASFAREIHYTTDVNTRHGRGFCRQLQSRCKMYSCFCKSMK